MSEFVDRHADSSSLGEAPETATEQRRNRPADSRWPTRDRKPPYRRVTAFDGRRWRASAHAEKSAFRRRPDARGGIAPAAGGRSPAVAAAPRLRPGAPCGKVRRAERFGRCRTGDQKTSSYPCCQRSALRRQRRRLTHTNRLAPAHGNTMIRRAQSRVTAAISKKIDVKIAEMATLGSGRRNQ